jgi:hypothetical protein
MLVHRQDITVHEGHALGMQPGSLILVFMRMNTVGEAALEQFGKG